MGGLPSIIGKLSGYVDDKGKLQTKGTVEFNGFTIYYMVYFHIVINSTDATVVDVNSTGRIDNKKIKTSKYEAVKEEFKKHQDVFKPFDVLKALE